MIKNKITLPAGHKAPTIEIKNISATHQYTHHCLTIESPSFKLKTFNIFLLISKMI